MIALEQQQDGSEHSADNAPTAEEVHALRQAPRANLNASTKGEYAERLVTRLVDDITAWEAGSSERAYARRKRLEKLKVAVAAFVADLLNARNHPEAAGWVYRPLAKGSFSGQAVSARDFGSIRDCWIACDLLDLKPGYTQTVEFDPGDPIRTRGKAARFRATLKLLKVCAEHGVTPQNVGEHFSYQPPEHPLVLTAASRRVGSRKQAGAVMKFKRTPRTERIEKSVKELNAFLAQRVVRGATHRWLTRRFNEGDQRDFNWNKGGRLYSDGKDSYQQLPRPERLKITIDGEPVCEIDIRASYLTILHARYKVPFKVSKGHDPYAIEGLPRAVVKAWCAIFLGRKKALARWPVDTIEKYAEENNGADLKAYRVKVVGEKGLSEVSIAEAMERAEGNLGRPDVA